MKQKRRQLTLFIDPPEAETIEKIRLAFNPAQYALISSHVTLCREEELVQIDKIKMNIAKLNQGCITIDFGNVVRFADGRGVLIPAIGSNEPFHQLRANILQGIIEKPGLPAPHITLMHPRNAACTDAVFAQIRKCKFPNKIKFRRISLIEQEPGVKWNILEEFELEN